MKLRIGQQSLRFRLSEKDLGQLATKGRLIETIRLTPRAKWCYSIEASHADDVPRVEAENENLRILLPQKQLQTWIHSHEIEWQFSEGSAAESLEIGVEKDLKGRS